MSRGVLLVGLGGIGQAYDLGQDAAQVHSHARAFAQHPRFHLLAGVDPDPERRAAFDGASGTAAFASLAEALAAHAPEVVVIATPTDSHAQVLEHVLASARPRLVLCEKPLAPTPAQGRAMLEACERAGVELFVNYFRRSLPGVREVRRRLQDGRIARGGKAVSWYSKGLLHNGSHFLDLLGWWLGPLKSARPLGSARPGPAGPECDCRLRFEGGDAVLLGAWEEAYSHFALELLARNGRLRFDGDGAMTWQPVVPDPLAAGYHALSAQAEAIDSGLTRYQWHVAEEIARHLDGATDAALCSGAEALTTLETIAALLAAAEGSEA